jgi:hypothetical protein
MIWKEAYRAMWSDNETHIDLLGVDRLVETLVFLAQEPHLRPLTVGIFADWGSGKSSLMRMAEQRLSAEPDRFLCLTFSPWQHEDYDDVKAALMAAVMTTLQAAVVTQRGRIGQLAHDVRERAKDGIKRLLRRINWFRLLGMGAKGAGALALVAQNNPAALAFALPALAEIPGIVKQSEAVAGEVLKEGEKEAAAAEPIEQRIGDFRHDFEAILKDLELEALVEFIDDLDRCLPNAILDTLEAIRLFLAVENTVFVIGADMRIIRHAIGTRYPELPGQQLEIGRDYLEKIVQIPLFIPPLNAAEAEAYLNLLGCQRSLDREEFAAVVDQAAQSRRTPGLEAAMNEGIARERLGKLPEDLPAFFALSARVAPILCANLHGNPRQLKRFLNTLILRQRLAQARNVNLDMAVMAKLMVLEYFDEFAFRELFVWQRAGSGVAAELGPLEDSARRPAEENAAKGWLTDPLLAAWLALEPPLAGTNLEPYYSAARDRVLLSLDTPRRLTPQLQEILGNLRSESSAVRQTATTAAVALPEEDFRALYDVLLDQFQRDPRAISGAIGSLIITLAQQRPTAVLALVRALHRTPPGRIQSAFAPSLASAFPRDAVPPEIRELLTTWTQQPDARPLAQAARDALESLAQPPRMSRPRRTQP